MLNMKIYRFKCRQLLYRIQYRDRLACLYLAATCISFYFICYYLFVHTATTNAPITVKVNYIDMKPEATVETVGCTISKVKQMDKISLAYLAKYPTSVLPCTVARPSLLDRNTTHIWIVEENIEYYVYKKHTDFELWCCYEPASWPLEVEGIFSEKVEYNRCSLFKPPKIIKVQDEFSKVTCFLGKEKIYQNLFLFAPKNPFVSINGRPELDASSPAYNVLVLGIDSVSRHNFQRSMPKTLTSLQKLGAIELLGYNNIGDYTLTSLVPLLMGLKHLEFIQYCMRVDIELVNECWFIWSQFKRKGFYTAVGHASRGRVFDDYQHFYGGPPPDYQLHLFHREKETRRVLYHKNLCLQRKAYFENLLDYILDVTVTLNSTKMFGFFWEATMSNLYLNYPVLMDDGYQNFLTQLNNSKYLDNTFLFLMSNHGFKNKRVIHTDQGQIEMRMPFVYVLVPSSFQKKYRKAYDNLLNNRDRLTTPFDIYKTLVDLTDLSKLRKRIKKNNNPIYMKRGISLFTQISKERTCASASINSFWCTCRLAVPIPLGLSKAIYTSRALIEYINGLLKLEKNCAKLKVKSIVEITEYSIPFIKNLREVVLQVRAKPGNGLFVGKIFFHEDKWDWNVVNVSRVNNYKVNGCISASKYAQFCTCMLKQT